MYVQEYRSIPSNAAHQQDGDNTDTQWKVLDNRLSIVPHLLQLSMRFWLSLVLVLPIIMRHAASQWALVAGAYF